MATIGPRDAWNFIERLWRKPYLHDLESGRKTPAIKVGSVKEPSFGLCSSLLRLRDNHDIDQKTLQFMQNQLAKFLAADKWTGGYHFGGLTLDGAISRADACKMFAQKCDGRMPE